MSKFAYEKLLEIYKLQEDVARRDYMESLRKLEIEKGLLQHMYKLSDQASEDIYELRSSDKGAPMERLNQLDIFLDGQKIKIDKQQEIISNHTRIVEQKQEILVAAAKERKILEKLKEKKMAELKKIEKKKEIKNTDEIVVTRYRGRM